MTHSLNEARRSLGQQLRDLRNDAGLTGRGLAALAGWHSSKISKIEHGRQTPSEEDIRRWCLYGSADSQVPDLVAAVRNIESMYVEWRRLLNSGTRIRQSTSRRLESNTRLIQWFEPVLIPGLLQVSECAREIIRSVIEFYEVTDDLESGIAERMKRQRILQRGDHRFHFIIGEQALRTTVGSREIMLGQLNRLLTVRSLPHIRLGVVPDDAEYRTPTNQFIMFDKKLVHVETISAELSISQPREVALYGKAFERLTRQAVTGAAAASMISTAIDELHASPCRS